MLERRSGGEAWTVYWPGRVPKLFWAPLTAGVLIAVVGLFGLAVGQPWLFPSLGPTAFLQAEVPDHRMARLYHVIVGHLLGLASGFAAVTLLGLEHAPAVLATHQINPARVAAAVLALFLTLLLSQVARALHPPAAATTLIVALGGFSTNVHDALVVLVGVLIVGIVGEIARRARLSEPLWPPLELTRRT